MPVKGSPKIESIDIEIEEEEEDERISPVKSIKNHFSTPLFHSYLPGYSIDQTVNCSPLSLERFPNLSSHRSLYLTLRVLRL